jgi:anaerobic magnesium-protoporphyrin IX monomethyl ester cyclase
MNMTKRKKIDVVLFNPAPRRGFQPHRRVELPLNLLYPATTLIHAGFSVKIVDQFADPHWERNLHDALIERPICFGVSCMTGPQIIRALAASKFFKRLYPDVPVVWGGIHASILPEQTLENPYVDIAVIGEGEATLLDLVKALANNDSLSRVAGIAYRENDQYHFTGPRPFVDLDKQLPLAYDLIDINLYRREIFGSDHVSFNSSRGCVYRCGFCYDSIVHRRVWRSMQPKTVVDQFRRLIRDYGISGFNFTDDNLFANMKHAYSLMEEIIRADLKIRIGKLHIRIDAIQKMDHEFLQLLVRAGVERLTIGVESGNQRILNLIRKDLRVEQVIEASRKLRPYSIVPVYLFMMGLPTETPQEFAQSIRLAQQLLHENPRASKSFNIYMPYPGTELYNLALQLGLRQPQRLEEWAPLNYRYVPRESPWITPETKKLISGLDFPLMFLGKGHFYKKTHPVVVGLARLYHPIARYRIKHLNAHFPIETKLVKALGLFGRQD